MKTFLSVWQLTYKYWKQIPICGDKCKCFVSYVNLNKTQNKNVSAFILQSVLSSLYGLKWFVRYLNPAPKPKYV